MLIQARRCERVSSSTNTTSLEASHSSKRGAKRLISPHRSLAIVIQLTEVQEVLYSLL